MQPLQYIDRAIESIYSLAMNRVLDLRRLHYFRTIAAFGSFSAAARSLNISQPALTYHLRELEAALGVKVFERSSKGVVLTDAGCRLDDHARNIFETIDTAEAEMRQLAKVRSKPQAVTLLVTHSLAVGLASELLQGIARALPGVPIQLRDETNDRCAEMMVANAADFSLMFATPLRPRAQPLAWQPLYLVSLDGDSSPVPFQALADEPLVLPPRGNMLRAMIDRAAAAAGLALNVVAEIHGVVARRQAVLAGLGRTILPWSVVASECQAGNLIARRMVEPALARLIVLDHRETGDANLAAQIRSIVGGLVEKSLHA